MYTASTIHEVRQANAQAGFYFFTRSTMKFFNSKIGTRLIKGKYFVTSEKYKEQSPRLYTIREFLPDGNIRTINKFQEYKTEAEAYEAIKRLI